MMSLPGEPSTFERMRLTCQSVLMGSGTSELDIMKTAALKAIKNGDMGGVKEKHFNYVMSVLNRDVYLFAPEVLNAISTINHRKDRVRAIRIVEFIARMLGNTVSEMPGSCITRCVTVLEDIRSFWTADVNSSAGSGAGGTSVDAQLNAMITYTISKATLLRSFPQLTGCFGSGERNSGVTDGRVGIKSPPISTTREMTNCLSTGLHLMTILLSSISSLEENVNLNGNTTLRERQAVKCGLRVLVKDLSALLVLNTTYLTCLCRSADRAATATGTVEMSTGMGFSGGGGGGGIFVSSAVINALISQYNIQYQQLRSLTLTVRGVKTIVLENLAPSSGFSEV